ncbi:MAG: hypothetical protein JWO32_2217 [Bacteroidetes bacterium]|nr:hypothetical protein [Bacteroidota bacterium]
MIKGCIILFFSLAIWGCIKDPKIPALKNVADYRDSITGNYKGIRIESSATGTTSVFTHDTSNIILSVSKSATDSLINVVFNPAFGVQPYTFKYHNNIFTPIVAYHAASLKKSSDSLFFHHQPALGPYWNDCNVKKQ